MLIIFFIAILYLFIGCITLITTLLFIELGRPKDIIQSGLLILQGIFLIIYKNIFTFEISLILVLNATLISFYFIENFKFRWNQLLDKEKLDIRSLNGFKKNFLIIFRIISLDLKNLFFNNKIQNIFKNTSVKKKWVRKEVNNNNSDKEASSKQYMTNIQTADFSKKDIINDEKINLGNIKIDKK
tara:strand:- start:96 stop:650 length:555 start_codon:yes stop_codon:yes gene_type:complete